MWQSNKQTEQPEGSTQTAGQNQTSNSASGTPATTTPAVAAPKNTSLAFTNALKTYQYRIQFDQCHGTVNLVGTGILSVKKGSKVMLDNRDDAAHTIAFAGQSVKVAANDFAIVTAGKSGTFNVTCDGGGAATLNVE